MQNSRFYRNVKIQLSELGKICFDVLFSLPLLMRGQDIHQLNTVKESMIALKKRLTQQDALSVLGFVCGRLSAKYSWLHIEDDCRNTLRYEMTRIQETASFLACNHPKAYLRSALFRDGERLYQAELKRKKRLQSVEQIDADLLEERATRDQSLPHAFAVIEDVRSYIKSLTGEERIICNSLMNGETGKELASKLAISSQYANRKLRKFCKRAQHSFRSYKYDRD